MQVDPAAPYKMMKIEVEAADKERNGYMIVCMVNWIDACSRVLGGSESRSQSPAHDINATMQVTTKKYVLVVAMSQHSSWAMLSDMAP